MCNVDRVLGSGNRGPSWCPNQAVHKTREPRLLPGRLAILRFIAEHLSRTPRTKIAPRARYVIHPSACRRQALREIDGGVGEGGAARVGVLVSQLGRLGSSDVGVLMDKWWRGLRWQRWVRRIGHGVQVGEDGGRIEALAEEVGGCFRGDREARLVVLRSAVRGVWDLVVVGCARGVLGQGRVDGVVRAGPGTRQRRAATVLDGLLGAGVGATAQGSGGGAVERGGGGMALLRVRCSFGQSLTFALVLHRPRVG